MHRRGRPVAKQQLFEQMFTLSDEANPECIELYIHRVRKSCKAATLPSKHCVVLVTAWNVPMMYASQRRWVKTPHSLFHQLLLFLVHRC